MSKWITITHYPHNTPETIDIDLKRIIPVIRQAEREDMFIIYADTYGYRINRYGREAIHAGIDEIAVMIRYAMIGNTYMVGGETKEMREVIAWDAKTDSFTFENGYELTYYHLMKQLNTPTPETT